MPFNGPIDGKWENVDTSRAPWTEELMTLTHDECLHVLDACKEIVDNQEEPLSDMDIYTKYNTSDWTYAVNWDTYNLLKGYNPEVNTLGINESGIVTEEQPIQDPAE